MKTILHINGEAIELDAVQKKPYEVRFTINGKEYSFLGQRLQNGSFVIDRETPQGWLRIGGTAFAAGKGTVRIQLGDTEAKVSPVIAGATAQASKLAPTAPMPGLIRQILVKIGDQVLAGQPLVVMEAMKLQTTLSAGGDAIVEAVLVKEGELVTDGAELVKLSPLTKK